MQHKEQRISGLCSVLWGEKKKRKKCPKKERKLGQKEGLKRSAQNGPSQSKG